MEEEATPRSGRMNLSECSASFQNRKHRILLIGRRMIVLPGGPAPGVDATTASWPICAES